MKSEHRDARELDELLKRALPDELPAEIAASMRARIDRYRSAAAAGEKRAAAGAWFLRRAVWAAVSVLMLVLGILLQGSASRSPLADKISQVKAAFASAEPNRSPGPTAESRIPAPDPSSAIRRMSHERDS